MPTYEYECTSCGRHIEVFQRFTEDALTTCAACGGALRKVFHPAGIVFKGSGFYATDSRSGGKGGTARKDGDASSGGEGKSGEGTSGEGKAGDGKKAETTTEKGSSGSSSSGGGAEGSKGPAKKKKDPA
jgi:putative FmdB family regulatory protein